MNLTERFQLLQNRAAEYAVQSDSLRDQEQELQAKLNGIQEQRAIIERGKSEIRGAMAILKEQIDEAGDAPAEIPTIADAKAKKAAKA